MMAGKVKDVAALACLLLMLLSFCANCVSSKPTADTAAVEEAVDSLVHSVAKRQSDYRDSRWRMMTALTVLNELSRMMPQRYQERPALISINKNSFNHTLLENILDSMCNLLAFYELAMKVNDSDSGYFCRIAGEIMTDSCNWMKYLVSQTSALITTHPIANISCTCAVSDITLLHQYCFRAKIARLRSITDIRNIALYVYATEYHKDDNPHVPATNVGSWLNNATSIPPNTRETIYRDMVMAILQDIIDMDLIQI